MCKISCNFSVISLYITVKLDFDIDRKSANFNLKNPQNISLRFHFILNLLWTFHGTQTILIMVINFIKLDGTDSCECKFYYKYGISHVNAHWESNALKSKSVLWWFFDTVWCNLWNFILYCCILLKHILSFHILYIYVPVTLFAGLNKNLRNHVFQSLAKFLNFMQKYFAAVQ